jgi:RHS repeat-associated protein
VASGVQPTIGFTGHVNDVDTGLTYMQQRYYDPVAGRFLSIDPVTTDANTGSSFNRYAYAKNNPYVYVDPDGRRDIYIGGAVDKNNTKIVQDLLVHKRRRTRAEIFSILVTRKRRKSQRQ